MVRRFWLGGLVLLFSASSFPLTALATTESASTPSVIISEIKLGGGNDVIFSDGSKAKDYVAIYNLSNETVSLTGWKLEYAKPDSFTSICISANWGGSSSTITTISDGTLAPGAVSFPIKRQLNDTGSGSLHLVDSTGVVQDTVGWGSTAPCYEGLAATVPASGKSLQRYLECDEDLPIDSNNNSADFASDQVSSPGILAEIRKSSCEPVVVPEDPEEEDNDDSEPTPAPSPTTSHCEGIVFTELLPNPSGSDSGREFIEFYNPTNKDISLQNCQLQTSTNNSIYTFPSVVVGSGKYKALDNNQTGLTLANSPGGTVWLLDHDDTELVQVDYVPDLDDDVAWALIGGIWKATYAPTPGAANILLSTKPCPDGKIRNPETNRCINSVVSSAGLVPCDPGKVRNPETNRCRSTTSVLSSLVPCDADEFRNPATNRCKKPSSSDGLKPCEEGKERNPETNRCRNVVALGGTSGMTDVSDIPSPSISQKVSWWFAGASLIGAVGYAVFEWRREITTGLLSFRNRFAAAAE